MSISQRIQQIQQKQGLSASAFADKLGVQRSGLSHIFSGRNKPSIDFIEKLLHNFPRTDAKWLITGEGDMYGEGTNDLFNQVRSENTAIYTKSGAKTTSGIQNAMDETEKTGINPHINTKPVVEKIIMVYNDGSFEVFFPKK